MRTIDFITSVPVLTISVAATLLGSISEESRALPPTLDTITLARSSTALLSQDRYSIAATTVGTKAMFAGGTQQGPGPYSNVDVFDLNSQTWSLDHLSVPRTALAATTVRDIAIFAGGAPEYGELATMDTVDLYNNRTGTWSTATLSQKRNNLAATAYGARAYISGGFVSAGNGFGPVFSDVIDVYDTLTQQWSVMNMPRPRAYHSSVTVGDKILFAGGTRDGSGIVDIYNVTSNTWTTGQLSTDRLDMAATVVGNKAIFVGGISGGQYQRAIDIYDAVTNTWSSDLLPHPTGYMAATTVGNYALFGGGVYTQYYGDVYLYDASKDKWLISKPSLSVARFDLAATSVGNLAIFAGGYGFRTIDMFKIPLQVPEPSTLSLLAIGVFCFVLKHSKNALAGPCLMCQGGAATLVPPTVPSRG